MSAGASPQTPLESLQRSPRSPSCFQGGRITAGGEWRRWKYWEEGRWESKRKGVGKEGKREKLGRE